MRRPKFRLALFATFGWLHGLGYDSALAIGFGDALLPNNSSNQARRGTYLERLHGALGLRAATNLCTRRSGAIRLAAEEEVSH